MKHSKSSKNKGKSATRGIITPLPSSIPHNRASHEESKSFNRDGKKLYG